VDKMPPPEMGEREKGWWDLANELTKHCIGRYADGTVQYSRLPIDIIGQWLKERATK
jgi:hypothetical protein